MDRNFSTTRTAVSNGNGRSVKNKTLRALFIFFFLYIKSSRSVLIDFLMSVYIVYSCFLIFAAYIPAHNGRSIYLACSILMSRSIDRLSGAFGWEHAIWAQGIAKRRSVKLFGHPCIFSSLKYFDYPPFSPPFFSSRSNTLSPMFIIHTHTCTHTHTFYFLVSSSYFPFSFLHPFMLSV